MRLTKFERRCGLFLDSNWVLHTAFFFIKNCLLWQWWLFQWHQALTVVQFYFNLRLNHLRLAPRRTNMACRFLCGIWGQTHADQPISFNSTFPPENRRCSVLQFCTVPSRLYSNLFAHWKTGQRHFFPNISSIGHVDMSTNNSKKKRTSNTGNFLINRSSAYINV